MTKRQSNRPARRLAPLESVSVEVLNSLAQTLRYAVTRSDNNGHHKLRPGDYGFQPPTNPRPSKDVCDDLRPVLAAEATGLFQAGIAAGMISPFEPGGTPKYVWAVDEHGEVYEAKTRPPDVVYHGYRLSEDERDMRRYVLDEWRRRCPRP